MRSLFQTTILVPVALTLAGVQSSSDTPSPRAFSRPLTCPTGYCPLLQGAPETAGMRSGLVRLKPRASVGWHTTGGHEESLVILRGSGEVQIEGKDKQRFTAPAFAYVPPETRHNVTNTAPGDLEYVYVVAPVKRK